MKYIFSLLSFYLFSFMLAFDSKAVLGGNEELFEESAMNLPYVRTKRALIPPDQENSLPSSPSKKTRWIENEMLSDPESYGSTQLSEAVVVHFATCLSPCTEVLEDSDDEAPSLLSSPAQYNPIARLNAIAAMKRQENIFSVEGTVRQKWHRNIYSSTLMLPESNG